MERVAATERFIKKFVRSYEQGAGRDRYIAASELQVFYSSWAD